MPLFPGQYDLFFRPTNTSYYIGLTPTQQRAIKQDVAREIRDTIQLPQLQGWTYQPYKILADANGHKAESSVQQDLETLVSGLGQGSNRISIRSDGVTFPTEPVLLGYDKQYDCGISCHHEYALHIDKGSGFSPWVIPIYNSGQTHNFEMRVSLMWLSASGVTAVTGGTSGVLVPFAVDVKSPPDRGRQEALRYLSEVKEVKQPRKESPPSKKSKRKAPR